MPTKQTSKRVKSKAEAKVSPGATNRPAAETERQPQSRNPRARPRSAAVGTNPTAATAAAVRKVRLNGSEDVHDKLEQGPVRSKPVAERADLAASRVSGAEQPPAGTKRAQLIGLLERPEGASIAEIGQRFGWLPHTVRAAITGLRKAGHEVTRSKDANDRPCTGSLLSKSPASGERAMPRRQNDASKEALARLPELDIADLRQQWRHLYKAEASPHLSRELLMRAIAYRMQEVALGALRPEAQRQLRQIVLELKQSGKTTACLRPQLKPGTRLLREWQGRSYEVLVLDDGYSWQGTQHRSLSAIARKITGTAWSGPFFFGLKPNQSAPRRLQASLQVSDPMEGSDAAS